MLVADTLCLVTGGAGMLALASARALLEHGASGVALLDLPSALEKGRHAIERLRTDFPSAGIVTEACDVTDAEGMEAAVQRVKKQLGNLDILCCFAGMVNCTPAEEMSIEEWRRMLDVNTTGAWIAAQTVGKYAYFLVSIAYMAQQNRPGHADGGIQTHDGVGARRQDRARRLDQRPPRQLPAAAGGLQRVQGGPAAHEEQPRGRVDPLRHPRQLHLPGVHGHGAQRGRGAGALAARVGGAEPDAADGRAARADGPGGVSVQ